MPRKTNKKQTRLAFAPTASSSNANEDENDRFARLSYAHPSLPTVRPDTSCQTKLASTPMEASSSTTTTSAQNTSPVKESKRKREKKEKATNKMDKTEKKEKKKSKLKEQDKEGKIPDSSATAQATIG